MKLLQQKQSNIEPLIELEHYFASICETVEKMTPYEQARVEYEISNLVGRIEIERLSETQHNPMRGYDIQPPYHQSHFSGHRPQNMPPQTYSTNTPQSYPIQEL